ncbi:hypothetical protein IAT40_003518 [Kwoniella sp. CBS 6097]
MRSAAILALIPFFATIASATVLPPADAPLVARQNDELDAPVPDFANLAATSVVSSAVAQVTGSAVSSASSKASSASAAVSSHAASSIASTATHPASASSAAASSVASKVSASASASKASASGKKSSAFHQIAWDGKVVALGLGAAVAAAAAL